MKDSKEDNKTRTAAIWQQTNECTKQQLQCIIILLAAGHGQRLLSTVFMVFGGVTGFSDYSVLSFFSDFFLFNQRREQTGTAENDDAGSTLLRKIKGKKERAGRGDLRGMYWQQECRRFFYFFVFLFLAVEQPYAGTAAGVEDLY